MSSAGRRLLVVTILAMALAAPLLAQEALPAEVRAGIDKAVNELLASSGAPSASIAVVRDGEIAYVQAYGFAMLDPKVPATPAMRYSIGSISKQFTASAILLLVEEGKLSLDDKLVRWFPDLTRANEVTIREILSMTSGYQDFWPQDYVMPRMLEPVTAQEILAEWGAKPLDFDPGTKWQYSNTNFVIAGLIVEKVGGKPLMDLLKERVFTPLHMTTVADTDEAPLGPGEPMRYMRYALGPPRPAPKEGRGWMFAAGELAMTARDLALWDISIIDRTILRPASYHALETEVRLANGVGCGYGLGVGVGMKNGRRYVAHDGEVSGFTAENVVFPDDRTAIVVQTNLDATGVTREIATRIGKLLLAAHDSKALAQARTILEGLQHGAVDRSLFTANANAYFSKQALEDFASSLGTLGAIEELEQQSQFLRGGMTGRRFRVVFKDQVLRITTFETSDGKIEQFQVAASE